MALDKNDGTFSPSIEGVISGKTSQVTGMNGLLNDLIGNDNYLKDKKLDRGNYTGTAEKLNNGVNSAWGGEYAGDIQDSIIKEVGKHYRDRINGKGYRCIKSGGSNITTNTTEYFEPCNVVDNLDKLQNLSDLKLLLQDESYENMVFANSTKDLIDSIRNYQYLGIQVGESVNDYDFRIIPTDLVTRSSDNAIFMEYYDNNGGSSELVGDHIVAIINFPSDKNVRIKRAYAKGTTLAEATFLKIRKVYGINKI